MGLEIGRLTKLVVSIHINTHQDERHRRHHSRCIAIDDEFEEPNRSIHHFIRQIGWRRISDRGNIFENGAGRRFQRHKTLINGIGQRRNCR